MEPRLRRAADASIGWYEDIFAVHGIGSVLEDGLGSGVVDVSNVHGLGGHAVDWTELAVAVAAVFPDRPIVGYEHGADLDAALAGGFDPVGELRVWVR